MVYQRPVKGYTGYVQPAYDLECTGHPLIPNSARGPRPPGGGPPGPNDGDDHGPWRPFRPLDPLQIERVHRGRAQIGNFMPEQQGPPGNGRPDDHAPRDDDEGGDGHQGGGGALVIADRQQQQQVEGADINPGRSVVPPRVVVQPPDVSAGEQLPGTSGTRESIPSSGTNASGQKRPAGDLAGPSAKR